MALKPFYNKKYDLGLEPKEVKDSLKSASKIPDFDEEDAGKILVVNAAGDGLEWKDPDEI